MYAKLAWRNVRRSVRDYAIYFVTLVFAVAMFYVFNSLADQPAFQALRGNPRRLAAGLLVALQWLSVIMTGVVALLVFYANRVIVRKRSRELGLYLLLGMEQGRLARLMLAEVTVIGLAALLAGLASGVFLSQLFALIVSRMFQVGLDEQPFVWSGSAAVRTIVCYGLAFIVVGVWQAASVYRQQLLDLIAGSRRNEPVRLRSRLLSVLALAAGVVAAGGAYWLADQVSRAAAVVPADPRIAAGIGLGIAGTYLLFAGAAGLLTQTRRQRFAGRGLGVFLYRQVTSKVNTHAGLLATVALMLTITVCAMSLGLGLGRGLSERAEREAPFDYLFYRLTYDGRVATDVDFGDILALFDQHGVTARSEVQFVTVTAGLDGADLVLPEDREWLQQAGAGDVLIHGWPQIMSASTYASLRAVKGYEAVAVPADTFVIHASAHDTVALRHARTAYERFLHSAPTLVLAGRPLQPALPHVLTEHLGDPLLGSSPLLIVPDDVAAELTPFFSYLVVQIAEPAPEALDAALDALSFRMNADGDFTVAQVRTEYVGRAFALEGMLLFIVSYVGVMFIVISATLLALQQVTDAVEHRRRFAVLQKLGADDRMIDGAIARQLGLYFLIPFGIAAVHALVALLALSRVFLLGGGYTTVWPAAGATMTVFVIVYGAYYALALQSCRALFRTPLAR